MKKRLALFALSFAILALLVYFSDTAKIAEVLSGANPYLLLLALSLWCADSAIRTLRWQVLLGRIGIKLTFVRAWNINVASMFFSNITPAKSGDPIRSVFLKRTEKHSFSSSLSSILVERVLDIVFLVAVALVSLLFLSAELASISVWIYYSIAFYVVAIVIGLYVVSSEARSRKFFSAAFRLFSFIPRIKSYQKRVDEGSSKLHKAFREYRHPQTIISATALTALLWFLEGFIVFLSFASIGLYVSMWACVAVIPFSILIGLLTLLPGAIGSSELVTVAFFTSLFPVSLAQVTAIALLSRLLLFWPYVLVGAIIFSLKFK